VGFILKETAGYVRAFPLQRDEPLLVDDIVIGRLDGTLRLTRTRQGIVMHAQLEASSRIDCMRCLTPFDLPFEVEFSDLFVFPAPIPIDPINPYYVDDGGFIDLTPILREEGILAVPIQALCKPDCKGLCPECGQNWNDAVCTCKKEEINPQMAKLKELLSD
jgi:uncharacterized protein